MASITLAADDTWTVPAGVTSVDVDLVAWPGETYPNGGAGGLPGRVQCTLAVTAGHTLSVDAAPGGSSSGNSADGGDGLYVSDGGTTLAAAGGGGGGGAGAAYAGGAGGGLTGGDGLPLTGSAQGGKGGTQAAGGAAGFGSLGNGTAGSKFAGGDGLGGGGGGWYGGGGGAFTGGGGGSSYTHPTYASSVVHTQGYTGSPTGYITLTWVSGPTDLPITPVDAAADVPTLALTAGTAVVLLAPVDAAAQPGTPTLAATGTVDLTISPPDAAAEPGNPIIDASAHLQITPADADAQPGTVTITLGTVDLAISPADAAAEPGAINVLGTNPVQLGITPVDADAQPGTVELERHVIVVQPAAYIPTATRTTKITLTDPATGHQLDELTVVDGTITAGEQDTVRRGMRLTVVDPAGRWAPGTPLGDAITTATVEVTVTLGYSYSDGTTDSYPAGVYRITQPERDAAGGGAVLQLTCSDRAVAIRGGIPIPVAVSGGITVVDAIAAMIHARLPTVEVAGPPDTPTVAPLLYPAGTDLWDEARKLAAGCGDDLAFDPTGTARIEPLTGTGGVPVAHYDPGNTLTCRTTQPDGGTPNTVTVKSPDGRVAAVAQDTRPGSLTRVDGPAGVRAVTITTASAGDTGQAAAAAQAYLARILGGDETVVATIPPDPALGPGAPVTFDLPGVGAQGDYIISALSLPLGVGQAEQITCRRFIDPLTLQVSSS